MPIIISVLDKTSGFVMTVAGGSGSFAGSSRLVSERIASAAASCRVTFGVYRNRDTEGTLALYLEDDAKFSTKVWTDPRKPVGRFWTSISVGIGRRRSGFRLVFISTHVGSTIASDISIDDVQYQECGLTTVGHCEAFTDPFNCSNGNCIHQDNVNDASSFSARIDHSFRFSYAISTTTVVTEAMRTTVANTLKCAVSKTMPSPSVRGRTTMMRTSSGHVFVAIK